MREKGLVSPIFLVSFVLGMIVVGLIVYFQFRPRSIQVQQEPVFTKENQITYEEKSSPIEISFIRDGNIWLANENGSDQKQITRDDFIEDFYWLPKSNKVVFSRVLQEKQKVISEIKILNVETGKEKAILKKENILSGVGEVGPHFDFRLTISQDGKKLAYSGSFLKDENGVVIFDFETETEKEILELGIQPVFSPDNQMLAGVFDGNIYAFSLKDFSKKQLTKFQSPTEFYKLYPELYSNFEYAKEAITWSKDGRKILFYFGNLGQGAMLDKSTRHIYQVDLNSFRVKKVTDSKLGETDFFLDQSPNGDEVYYIQFQERNNHYSLKKSNILNNKVEQINLSQGLDLPSAELKWKISPSGRKVIYEFLKIIPLENKPFSPTKTIYEVWQINSDSTNNRKIIDNAENPKWRY